MMEQKRVTPEMTAMLREPLPAAAISQHPTKTYLSSIKAIFVTERLNKVFGVGTWKLKSDFVREDEGMIVVYTTLTIPEYGIELSSFGGNDNGGENSKNFDLGDAYKGATTDALTKICSWLEIGIDVFKGNKGVTLENHQEAKLNALLALTKIASREALESTYKFYKKQFGADLDFVRLLQIMGEKFPKNENVAA